MSNASTTEAQLKGMSLFAEFTDAELDALCHLVDPTEVSAGDCIVRQDERGDCMYVLGKGAARVIHRRDDRSFELAILKPGDFFGELALVDAGPRSANVEAIEDCTLYAIGQSVIAALVGVYPSAGFKFLIAVGRIMVSRMRKGNAKYIDSLLVTSDAGR